MNSKIRYYRGKIDLENFEAVMSPVDRKRVMAIGVSPSGHLSMNENFRSAVRSLTVDFRISKDRKTIVIDDSGSGEYTFPKSGNIKDVEFVRLLSAVGLEIPCRYIMKYSEEQKLWVGEYSESLYGGKSRLERELDKISSGKTRRKKNG